MMEKGVIATIRCLAVLLVLAFVNCMPAYGYVLDGDLSDWGVTPFTDWTPNGSRIDWREADDTNKYPGGGLGIHTSGFYESRDYEAMYFDNDNQYLYWALVSSVPFDPDYSRVSPKPEDLAIDANGDGINEFGLKVGLLGARQDSGLPVESDVYSVTRWYSVSGGDYKIRSGTKIGTYEIFNRYLGKIEPWEGAGHEPHDVNSGFGWTSRTYVLEARVDKLLLGNPQPGDDIRLFFAKYECITDYIWVDGTINGGGLVPEPSTFFLLGGGLAALARLKRRKK